MHSHNCSPVFVSSAWCLRSGANGDFLQEDLCYKPCLPGVLKPEPLSLRQVTADLCLYSRHSTLKTGLAQYLLGGSLILSLNLGHAQDFVCVHQVSLAGLRFDFKYDCAPPTILLGLLLCLWMWGNFFGGIQHPPFNGCSTARCDFGVLAGEYGCTSFYSDILPR